MSDLRDLYQEMILDHSRNPRNFRALEETRHRAEGFNPLCGDQLTVYLDLSDDRVADACFQGSGCAICTASASLMTEAVKDRTRSEITALFDEFMAMLTRKDRSSSAEERLGKLNVLAGVSEFPIRVKCATLAWHALHAALEGKHDPVTTE